MKTTEVFYKGYPLTIKKKDNGALFVNAKELSLALNYQDNARRKRSGHGIRSAVKCLGLDTVLIDSVVYIGEIEMYTVLNHSRLPEREEFLNFIVKVCGSETTSSVKRYTKQRYKDVKNGNIESEAVPKEDIVEKILRPFTMRELSSDIKFEDIESITEEDILKEEVAVTESVVEPNERIQFLLEKVNHLEEIIRVKDKMIAMLEK